MPNGFWFAGGKSHRIETSIPSSAFSKGDLLLFDSNSSLSRVPWASSPGLASGDILGVALSDSIDSINNQVSFLVPGPDTLFWASLQSVDATALTPSLECDIHFDVVENRYFVDPSSTGTTRVVLVRGNVGVGAIDQSVQSKVLCKLIYHAGNLELS